MNTRVTIDFDHHDPAYREGWAEAAAERAVKYPVAWTESHGGFWVLSGYEEVSRAASEPDNFSSAHMDPEKPWAKGIMIPELPYPLPLSESDPPVHHRRRMIEAPFFAPGPLRSVAGRVQDTVDKVVEDVRQRGRIDFVRDFAVPIAARSAMDLVGIDPDQWEAYMLPAHKSSMLPSDHPDFPIDEIRKVQTMLKERVVERRGCPFQKNVLSALAHGKVMDAPLTDAEAVGMLSALVFGGFGTTVSGTLNTLRWLEHQHDIRERLLTDDDLLNRLFDEVLRLNPPNHGTARTVARDMELGGQQLRQGDRVMLSWVAANRDPKKFPRPNELDLGRPNGQDHLSYGGGHHKCLGAPLARIEARMMVRAVLMHMPDYRIEHDNVRPYLTYAAAMGFIAMPVQFTPIDAGVAA
jgi:cytochrome P450